MSYEVKRSIFSSQDVCKKSRKGALVSPRPPGDVEIGGKRKVGVREQTKETEDGRLNEDP